MDPLLLRVSFSLFLLCLGAGLDSGSNLSAQASYKHTFCGAELTIDTRILCTLLSNSSFTIKSKPEKALFHTIPLTVCKRTDLYKIIVSTIARSILSFAQSHLNRLLIDLPSILKQKKSISKYIRKRT